MLLKPFWCTLLVSVNRSKSFDWSFYASARFKWPILFILWSISDVQYTLSQMLFLSVFNHTVFSLLYFSIVFTDLCTMEFTSYYFFALIYFDDIGMIISSQNYSGLCNNKRIFQKHISHNYLINSDKFSCGLYILYCAFQSVPSQGCI